MDSWNNEIGNNIGVANPNATIEQLFDLLCAELQQGGLKVFENPNDPNSTVIFSNNCEECPN